MSARSPTNLLHRDKLKDFKAWILDGKGYMLIPQTAHAYEVLRIRKYCRSGDEPDIVFYQRMLPTQHVTLCPEGRKLVQRWIRSRT